MEKHEDEHHEGGITLDAFITAERRRLERFRQFWLKGQSEEGPDMYPDAMMPGDWDMQLQVFEEE